MVSKISSVVLFLVFASFATANHPNVSRNVYHNPIMDINTPDPFVYLHSDGFYYLPRARDGRILDLYKSKSLVDFRGAEVRQIYEAPNGLMGLWAPEIHFIYGGFYIYFCLDDGDNANHRSYVIRANDNLIPMGRWSTEIRLSTPTEDYWSIDGTPLLYNNRLYFIWSGWPTIDAGFPQNLYIAPMSNPETISGPRVLLREPKSHWETIAAPINEAPQIIQHMNRTFLTFSASGSWTADYCLGLIGIDDFKDPLVASNWWQDVDRCVFWRNDAEGVYGTGHASFANSKDGTESFMIYHAMEHPDGGWENRTARAERFGWNPDHSPAFPRPRGFHFAHDLPSGE